MIFTEEQIQMANNRGRFKYLERNEIMKEQQEALAQISITPRGRLDPSVERQWIGIVTAGRLHSGRSTFYGVYCQKTGVLRPAEIGEAWMMGANID